MHLSHDAPLLAAVFHSVGAIDVRIVRCVVKVALSGSIGPGATRAITVVVPVSLSDKGGIITLLDDRGLEVDGVAYTKSQVKDPGWTVKF